MVMVICYATRFDVDTATMLYSSVVRSHLEFACLLWFPHHDAHVSTLESVQRQFILYVNSDRHIDSDEDNHRLRPYADRCAELNLESLVRRQFRLTMSLWHFNERTLLYNKIQIEP